MIKILINTLRPRQNSRHFTDDIFKWVFLNGNVLIFHWIFIPKGQINNIPTLVQIVAWCRPGDRPLSEPMMISLQPLICITGPQWVNNLPGQFEKEFFSPVHCSCTVAVAACGLGTTGIFQIGFYTPDESLSYYGMARFIRPSVRPSISCEIALIWMSLDLTDDQSTLVQVMAWCCQAKSHYLSQCWPRCLSLYGVTRPEWVNWCYCKIFIIT